MCAKKSNVGDESGCETRDVSEVRSGDAETFTLFFIFSPSVPCPRYLQGLARAGSLAAPLTKLL